MTSQRKLIHCVTGPKLPFFHRRKGILKIDQSFREIGFVWELHAPTHWLLAILIQVHKWGKKEKYKFRN